jgi:CheY-like chemotaxis protein
MPALLLIEDNADLRKVISEAVEMDGYIVTIASDAEAALSLLYDGYTPAVIISDIVMPNMSGLDFLRELRANQRWQNINVIAMSGTINSKTDALDAGANHYLVKPFSFHDLFALLAQG